MVVVGNCKRQNTKKNEDKDITENKKSQKERLIKKPIK
jgi:hypothetical protein